MPDTAGSTDSSGSAQTASVFCGPKVLRLNESSTAFAP
jgi:hypothetical protein